MAHIIPLRGDPHAQTLGLLPWYANGTLDADETALVEAHLADCAECRAELESERALALQVASMPLTTESGWETLRDRITARPAAPALPARFTPRSFLRRPVAIGWAVAAQAAVLLLVVGVTRIPAPAPAYHTLSSAPAAQAGNIVVVFRPDTTEAQLRDALRASSARLVDGPTTSNAYVLRVPAAERSAALGALRATGHVVLAEPIDAGTEP